MRCRWGWLQRSRRRCGRTYPDRMDLAPVVDIAERAGRLQVQRRPSLVVKGTKAHVNDIVADVDLASEQLIGDAVAALWPDDGILGEEGHDTAGTSGRRWIVDPLVTYLAAGRLDAAVLVDTK